MANTLQESLFTHLNSSFTYPGYFQFAEDGASYPTWVLWTVAGEDDKDYFCDQKGGTYIMQIDLFAVQGATGNPRYTLLDDREAMKDILRAMRGQTIEGFTYNTISLSDTPDVNSKTDDIFQQSIQVTINWSVI